MERVKTENKAVDPQRHCIVLQLRTQAYTLIYVVKLSQGSHLKEIQPRVHMSGSCHKSFLHIITIALMCRAWNTTFGSALVQ